MPEHTYEEIRSIALDILSGREKTNYPPQQYANLEHGIAEVFQRREAVSVRQGGISITGSDARPLPSDADLILEVFWNLFREGIVTLGLNSSNPQFPFFRVSHFGKAILQNQSVYFFHDVSTYESLIKEQVPAIDPVTLIYLKEAMQAFRTGCLLSATVMLGVATEHTFLLLLETIDANPAHQARYASVQKEWSILRKLNKFRATLDKDLPSLPADAKEDLETQFAGIQSMIRDYRNESGHPTGKIVGREQVYVLLSLFIPYAKKMYRLMEHFKGAT